MLSDAILGARQTALLWTLLPVDNPKPYSKKLKRVFRKQKFCDNR